MEREIEQQKNYEQVERMIRAAIMLAEKPNMNAFDCLRYNIRKNVVPFKKEELELAKKILNVFNYYNKLTEMSNNYIAERNHQLESRFNHRKMKLSKKEQKERMDSLCKIRSYNLPKNINMVEKFIDNIIETNLNILENRDCGNKQYEILINPLTKEQTKIYENLFVVKELQNEEPTR